MARLRVGRDLERLALGGSAGSAPALQASCREKRDRSGGEQDQIEARRRASSFYRWFARDDRPS